ncbi:MAG: PAS domain-containing sensor histidine kinase, partial [Methanoregula sp.]|nr:PAS domain-containing sensor histidine kinase [Methanoregula sp.]
NEHFGKMVGYKKEELEEVKNLLSFVVRDDLGKVTEYHDLIGQNPADPPKHYEFRLKDREGKIKNIYMIQDIIPGTPRRVNSLIDITELRKIEEDLRHELTRKREFIVLASHELRTPLQPLIMFLQILTEDSGSFGMNAEALTMLKKCQQYIEREREMVELVIKLSEMGGSPDEVLPQVQPNPRKVSPEELIRSHITIIRYSSKLELTIDIPKDLVITTDSEYFYLIFESLVFYLINRSPVPARITISYRANGKNAEFFITNPATHIPPEVIPEVFTPFQVSDESKLLEKYGFIGMSLPVAKKMAELLGGTITIASDPDIGTTFILSLPE